MSGIQKLATKSYLFSLKIGARFPKLMKLSTKTNGKVFMPKLEAFTNKAIDKATGLNISAVRKDISCLLAKENACINKDHKNMDRYISSALEADIIAYETLRAFGIGAEDGLTDFHSFCLAQYHRWGLLARWRFQSLGRGSKAALETYAAAVRSSNPVQNYCGLIEPSSGNFFFADNELKGKRLLDLGCNTGSRLYSLRITNNHGHLNDPFAFTEGLDRDPVIVAFANKILDRPYVKLGDFFEPLPYPDETFDFVTSNYAMYYYFNWEQSLYNLAKEIQRVLKRNGMAFLDTGGLSFSKKELEIFKRLIDITLVPGKYMIFKKL
jgi:SAM-dependent methyltransferase